MHRAIFPSIIMLISTLFSSDVDLHHEFCESKLWEHRIEILNVITSLAMIYFPIKSYLKKQKNRDYLPEEILMFVSIGSALFHYNNTYLTALFDEIPMLIFLFVIINKAFPNNKTIGIINFVTFTVITLLKIGGMSSFMFSVLYATCSVFFGLYSTAYGAMSIQLAVKLILISGLRQFTEDYCLQIPLVIAALGHPMWHIFISKYSVELADELHDFDEKNGELTPFAQILWNFFYC